ncbi:MAG: hypothetical protein P8X80_07425 [Desulfobacterales bacterium]|jgi:hypothetical protein
MKTQIRRIGLSILIFTVIACSGTMKGIDRYTGKRVYLTYEDENFGSGAIQMTMPDGERFVGGIVDETTPGSIKEYQRVSEFSGDTEALLMGDSGGKMRCKFRLSDTILGFKGGGYGLCETDDGRVIDIFTR